MSFIPNAPNMMAWLTNLGEPKNKISQTCWPIVFLLFHSYEKNPRGTLIVGNLAIEKGLFLGNQKPYYTILCCGPTSWVPTYSLCFLYHQPLSHTSIRSPINLHEVQVDQTNRGWSLGWSICRKDSLLTPMGKPFGPNGLRGYSLKPNHPPPDKRSLRPQRPPPAPSALARPSRSRIADLWVSRPRKKRSSPSESSGTRGEKRQVLSRYWSSS